MRIIDYIDRGLQKDPDRPLLIADDETVTHADAGEASWAIAAGLRAQGHQIGDTVGILAPNGAAGLITMFGLWRAGGVWAPLNPYNAIEATTDFMTRSKCKWLFLHSSFAEYAPIIAESVPTLETIVCLDTPFLGGVPMDEMIEAGKGTSIPDWNDAHGRPDMACVHWPTGGTTGRSKAVVWTNRTFAALLETASRHWPSHGDLVNLAVAPMTHAAGVMAVLYAALGATIVVRPNFRARDTLEQIERHRVTHIFLPPTAFYDLSHEQKTSGADCSSLQMLLLSAAPISPQRMAEGVPLFGDCIAQSWGQAESPFMLTFLSPTDVRQAVEGIHPERLSSCGKPTFSSQVVAMDPEGNILSPNAHGELVARGALVTPGYLDQPTENEEIRRFGWHHTGDVGYVDDDGYVYVIDRLKDMIISGGFNIYAAEVESVLLETEGVKSCAVIGTPDERWGESVIAIVVPSNSETRDATELLTQARLRLGAVKTPKQVYFVDKLPQTPVGKIDKKALRSNFDAVATSPSESNS